MIVIDRALQIALYHYNRGIERAKAAYYGEDVYASCAASICTDSITCWRCRQRARADLRVATSEAECAELLAIIDRPSPAAAECGTNAGYNAHYARGEKPCHRCRSVRSRYQQARRRVLP